MFAVVKTGGKQYKVAQDEIIKLEKLDGEVGDTVTFDQVLMLKDDSGLKTGAPLVDGAVVTAEILEQTRGDKVIVFKKRRRHTFRKRNGHRQYLTVVKITGVGKPGSAKKKAPAKEAEPKEEPIAAAASVPAAPEGAKDDLKRISGVGKVLEGKLNDLGIVSFQQIVDLTPEQRDDVEEQLSFKGRMEREDWEGQAKQFLAEKE
ncbi:MAG: 50S ribosomal protein L21 [Pseudomonadota bacterium]